MLEMMPPWAFKDEPPRFLKAWQGETEIKLDLKREVCHLNDSDFISLTPGEFKLLKFLMEKPNEAHYLEDIRAELGIMSVNSVNLRLSKLRKKITPIEIQPNQRGSIYLQDDGRAPNIVAEAHGIHIDKTDRVFYGDKEVRFAQSHQKLRGMLQGMLEGHTIPTRDNVTDMHFIRKGLADASKSDDAPDGLSFIELRGNQYALRHSPMVRQGPSERDGYAEPSPSDDDTLEL